MNAREPTHHADVYTNLFWSYGNAGLENNCTRAMVVALRTCGDRTTARFLRRFAGISARGPFTLALQAAPDTAKVAPGATVLAITTARRRDVARRVRLDGKLRVPRSELVGRAIPDAWVIDGLGEVQLLVESKLGPRFDHAQIERHAVQHLGGRVGARAKHASWEDVAAFFTGEIELLHGSSPGAFVAREFVAYLDLLGLLPFQQFKAHHFAQGEVRDGFAALMTKVQSQKGFERRRWRMHPWDEPDADFRGVGGGIGNTGLAMWRGVDGLAVKLAIGASSKAEIDRILERADDASWMRSVQRSLARTAPFTAEIKIRAQYANANCFVPVEKLVDASSGDLSEITDRLAACHLDRRWSRRALVRWLDEQRVMPSVVEGWLDNHSQFNVYGHLLIYTSIPPKVLVTKDLDRVAGIAAARLSDMERVRRALDGNA